MTTKDAIEFADLAIRLARWAPNSSSYRIASGVAKLARLGTEAHTHAERQCNEDLSDEYCAKKRSSIAKRTGAVLQEMGLMSDSMGYPIKWEIEVHGDPRGSCLQIVRGDLSDAGENRIRF